MHALGRGVREADELAAAGHGERALTRRAEAIDMLRASGDPAASPVLVEAMFKQAGALARAGRTDDAVALLVELAEQYGDVAVPGKDIDVEFEALRTAAISYSRAERYDHAVEIAEAMSNRTMGRPGRDAAAAWALVFKARCLLTMGQTEKGLAILAEVIDRFGESRDRGVANLVATAMFNRAARLRDCGRHPDAVLGWRKTFDRFRREPPTDDPALPFRALLAAVQILLIDGCLQDALETARTLIACLEEDRSEDLIREIARMAIRAGNTFHHHQAYEQALEVYNDVESRLARASTDRLRALAVSAHLHAGFTLARQGQIASAISASKDVFRLGEPALIALQEMADDASEEPSTHQRAAWALLMRALLLGELRREEEARAGFRHITEVFSNDDSPLVRAFVTVAREALAEFEGRR